MAAIGDSITQAANADGNNIGAEHPEHSWSTGYDSGDVRELLPPDNADPHVGVADGEDLRPQRARRLPTLVAVLHDWYQSWIWNQFDVCQSMLDTANTEADRQFVRQRNIDFNTVLRNVCALYTQCRYDDIAARSWQFGYWPTV